jgi:hypothetical protein
MVGILEGSVQVEISLTTVCLPLSFCVLSPLSSIGVFTVIFSNNSLHHHQSHLYDSHCIHYLCQHHHQPINSVTFFETIVPMIASCYSSTDDDNNEDALHAACQRSRLHQILCDGKQPCLSCKNMHLSKTYAVHADGIDKSAFNCTYLAQKRNGCSRANDGWMTMYKRLIDCKL